MSDYITITDARANFPKLVEKVGRTMKRVTITVKGKPQAVIMSHDDFESLEETMEILSDKQLMKSIHEGEKDIKAGRVYDWEDVKKELMRNNKNHVQTKTRRRSQKRA